MTDFNKTTITAVVPAFLKEEGKVLTQNNDFIVFQTKKRRSSRGLKRYLAWDNIIAIQTDKDDNAIVWYLEPNFPVEFRNIEFDKLASSNTAGFVNAKLANGLLSINRKLMRINTETSSVPTTLKKSKKEAKPEKSDKKKEKKAK